VQVNKYIQFGQYPIPNVQRTLERLQGYSYFIECDGYNMFHQLVYDDETSDKLSVQTIWGEFRPKFVLEGVAPATAVLQETMDNMFADLGDWCIPVFDNVIIGAHSYDDCVDKLKLFLDRCRHHNFYVKMAKCVFGVENTNFFGYNISGKSFKMMPDRAEALKKIPFPSGTPAQNQTAMRSFLGQTRIFQPHIPDYALITKHLDEMTKKDFSWDESTWKVDHRTIFSSFIDTLTHAMELFYPDFDLEWVLRTDACNTGYGGILYQIRIVDGKKQFEPIKFISKRFTEAATRWDTFSQECYGITACVKACDYLLRGKAFTIETDHANLAYLQTSEVPKIVRQHLYLRSFICFIRHTPGKSNTADYWSRLLQTIYATASAATFTGGGRRRSSRNDQRAH
jgi:hypothetical protein